MREQTLSVLNKLLPAINKLADLSAAIGSRFSGRIGFLALTGWLAVAWCCYLFWQMWQFSTLALSISGFILALPVLALSGCWWVLSELHNLPQRLLACLQRLHLYAAEKKPAVDAVDSAKPGFKALWQLGSLAWELKSLGDDASDLLAILRGSLWLTNPLFLTVLLGSAVTVLLLDAGVLLGSVIYWLG